MKKSPQVKSGRRLNQQVAVFDGDRISGMGLEFYHLTRPVTIKLGASCKAWLKFSIAPE